MFGAVRAVGGLAGHCQSPRALGLDMSIRRGLGFSGGFILGGRALGCEGGR